ncbi:MAG: glycosyltransferase, partial [Chloroflexota bacterium]
PDVACAFFGMPSGPIALLLREALGVPYLVSLRGGDVPGFMGQEMAAYHALARPVIRAVWRRSAGLIANSPGLADLARRTWPEAPLTVIPNGVDVETFCPPNRPRPASPLRLLSVGRLVKQKGMGDALAALARSKSAALLRVVGDGPERSALEAQARTLGIADRVELAGWATRAELPAHYQWADALILPSREEGMANVVLEALAAGLPAITTAIYGNRDLVAHGHNGFLTRPGDVGALAAAIDQLATEPELVRAMGHHSRQAALARRWDHVAEQYRLELAAAISAPVSSVEGAPGRPPRRLGAVDQPA